MVSNAVKDRAVKFERFGGALKVSIFLPVFKSAAYLEATLSSIDGQNYENFEVLVYEDGADEQTCRILEQWCKRNPRIRVISNGSNRGVGYSYLRFLADATGDALAQIGHDDIWSSAFLETMVGALVAANADVAFSETEIINGDSEVLGFNLFTARDLSGLSAESLARRLFAGNFLCAASSLTRRSALGGLDLPGEVDQLQDWLTWLLLSLASSFIFVPGAIVGYRVHGRNLSLSSSRPNQVQNELALVRAAFIGNIEFASFILRASEPERLFADFLDIFSKSHADPRSAVLLELALRAHTLKLNSVPSFRRALAAAIWGTGEFAHSLSIYPKLIPQNGCRHYFVFIGKFDNGLQANSSGWRLTAGAFTVLALRLPTAGFKRRLHLTLSLRNETLLNAVERVIARERLGVTNFQVFMSKLRDRRWFGKIVR